MALEDARMTRNIQREVSRRYIDATRLDVRVIHGVCYFRGSISALRTHPEVNLEHESEIIRKIIHQHSGIKSVVWDVRMNN